METGVFPTEQGCFHLWSRETRESLGVRVKGNVVIVDEAHNLIDSIAQVLFYARGGCLHFGGYSRRT